MKNKYYDIVNEKVPEPKERMPQENRAAQFSSFAALNGYEEAIDEVTIKQREQPKSVDNDEYYQEQ